MLGQARFLAPYLTKDARYLEVGPGACSLACHIAPQVNRVYAVDVTSSLIDGVALPTNLEFVISDGASIPVPQGSIDVVFSNQLMEHLHPEDALRQLANIHRAMKVGGTYLCFTPNRLSGPHDISKHFDDEATCFHLQEYTYQVLCSLFESVGFGRFKAVIGYRGWGMRTSTRAIQRVESLLEHLPMRARKVISRSPPIRLVLGVKLLAQKL